MTTARDIAKMIYHSILHPTLTDKDLIDNCGIAKKYNIEIEEDLKLKQNIACLKSGLTLQAASGHWISC